MIAPHAMMFRLLLEVRAADRPARDVWAAWYQRGISVDKDAVWTEPDSPIVTDLSDDHTPRWAPGDGVMYLTNHDGPSHIFVRHPDDKTPHVWVSDDDVTDARWSPNGKHLAYVRTPRGLRNGDHARSQLYVTDAEVRKKTRLELPEQSPTDIAWSQDGRTLFFCDGPSGNLYAVGAAHEAPRQLSAGVCAHPAASPDGRHLAYLEQEDPATWHVTVKDLETGGERRASTPLPVLHPESLCWLPDASRLIVCGTDPEALQSTALAIPNGPGEPQVLNTRLEDGQIITGIECYDARRDGRRW